MSFYQEEVLQEEGNPQRNVGKGEVDFPKSMSHTEIKLQILSREVEANSQIEIVHEAKYRDTKRSVKFAVLYKVIDKHSKEFKKYKLTLYALKRLKDGHHEVFTYPFGIDGAEVEGQPDEITALGEFFRVIIEKRLPNFGGTYEVVRHDSPFYHLICGEYNYAVKELLEEDAQFRAALVREGGQALLNILAEELGQFVTAKDVADAFNTAKGEDRGALLRAIKSTSLSPSDLDIMSGRVEAAEAYRDMLGQELDDEKEWQVFFEANEWIFGYGLDYRYLSIIEREAVVSGSIVGGRETVHTDFLSGDPRFTVLIELKTPATPIFGKKKNRSRAWSLSSELQDAVSQAIVQRIEWQSKASNPNDLYTKDGENIIQDTVLPQAIIIIGKLDCIEGSDLEKKIKLRTFESYRMSIQGITILTFDELLARAEHIVGKEI